MQRENEHEIINAYQEAITGTWDKLRETGVVGPTYNMAEVTKDCALAMFVLALEEFAEALHISPETIVAASQNSGLGNSAE